MAESSVRDIMTADPVTIEPDLGVTEAARLMIEKDIGSLLVMEEGRLIGIVTEGDLIMQDVKLKYPTYLHFLGGIITYPAATARFETELKKAVAADVRAVMTADPVSIQVSVTVEDAATALVERDVSHLPVLDGETLVGIVSKSDIVRTLLTED